MDHALPAAVTPSLLSWPHYSALSSLFLELTKRTPTPDCTGMFFAQVSICLTHLPRQLSAHLPSPEDSPAHKVSEPPRNNHHDQGTCEHFTLGHSSKHLPFSYTIFSTNFGHICCFFYQKHELPPSRHLICLTPHQTVATT